VSLILDYSDSKAQKLGRKEGRKEGRWVGGWVGPFESFAFAAQVTTTIIIMVHSYCKAISKVKWLAQVVL
jgi:hypothetical protein